MALMVCRGCGTKFAVGLHRCPQCTAEDAYMDGDDMPKITVHGGPSVAGEQEGGDQSSPGNSSSTSTERPPTSDATSSPDLQSPAPTTESPSIPDQTGDSSAPSTDGDLTAESADSPYDGWTKPELQTELEKRDLPKSGNVPELIERLVAHDAADATRE